MVRWRALCWKLHRKLPSRGVIRNLHYEQGQATKEYSREYFYFIDHQGMLFLDDSRMKNFTSCFKEKKFLEFFFRRLRHNDTGKYEAEFPFISPCGREMNFVHCDDVPFVFTHIVQLPEESKQPGSKGFLLHNHAGNLLKVEFTPQHLCMPAGTGRVYHPAPERAGGVGLVRSLLAIELSKHFTFADDSEKTPPTHFDWDGTRYELTNSLLPVINKVSSWNGTE
ncbi:UPF0598 protein CG30010 [Dermacentor silvarum]|uniref:UPF0598 protein CG30010 n=1 Tax=Dermacentor silvarum TaxID=543639 RepID=UPI00189B0E83|nr:UPF0598 protein CG30010 [Dermacentor silvarum]